MFSTKWIVVVVALAATVAGVAAAEPGTRSELTVLSGRGSGSVEVSPTSKNSPIFDVEGTVNLHGGLPDATYRVARAVDRGDIGAADAKASPSS